MRPAATDGFPPELEQLYVEQRPRLLRWLAFRLRDPADAEDVVQDAIIRMANLLAKDPARAYQICKPAYFRSVALSVCTDKGRRDARELRILSGPKCWPTVQHDSPNVEARLTVRAALDNLPERCREATILVLRHHDCDEVSFGLSLWSICHATPSLEGRWPRSTSSISRSQSAPI
ncbi:MAG TPA: RNA polymerase sigma factor [Longimicrobiales bacterium]|nr:RNA polymerase sigma factor [Longimicrobiales bacterium]